MFIFIIFNQKKQLYDVPLIASSEITCHTREHKYILKPNEYDYLRIKYFSPIIQWVIKRHRTMQLVPRNKERTRENGAS